MHGLGLGCHPATLLFDLVYANYQIFYLLFVLETHLLQIATFLFESRVLLD